MLDSIVFQDSSVVSVERKKKQPYSSIPGGVAYFTHPPTPPVVPKILLINEQALTPHQ